MNSFKGDYEKLYQLQDKFLSWWISLGMPFYLTGGTALGRFYLNHRYSEDLDFFVNRDPRYPEYIAAIKTGIENSFILNNQDSLYTEDFTRFYISDGALSLKIELVNDIEYYPGKPSLYEFGLIDTPLNILSNKLTALVSRDEPKDVFDIICLSLRYSFNWKVVFSHTKEKAVINEIDVEQRLCTFPVEWLSTVNWLKAPADLPLLSTYLQRIADDFLLGLDNSLGSGKVMLLEATPNRQVG